MSSSQPLRDASAADDGFLGHVVAFTVPDRDVDLKHLRGLLGKYGLATDAVKSRIRRIDAFKRATSDIATKFTRHADHQHQLLVNEVGQTHQESHRLVVLQRSIFRAGQRRRVEHETLYRIMYDRGTRQGDQVVDDRISVERQIVEGLILAPEEKAWLDKTIGEDGEALIANFDRLSTHLGGDGVRVFVREYLRRLDAANGTSGGLYFVPQARLPELECLCEVVRAIGSSMHLMPLLDRPDLRDMVAECITTDVNDILRGYEADIARIAATPTRRVQAGTYDSLIGKADALLVKVGTYEEIVGYTLQVARDQLAASRERAAALASRVQRPKSLASRKTEAHDD